MKKSLFFVATAALVLASCSNDVKIDENVALEGSNAQKEIAFTAYAHTPKRAVKRAPVNSAEFPTGYNFFLVAYSHGAGADYFEAAEYAHYGSTLWAGKDGSNKRYWPLAPDTINFLAVTTKADIAAGTTVTFGTGTPTKSNFANRVDVTLADNKTIQHDLMYAYGRDSVVQKGNALRFPDQVDMKFNHALAWVYFRVKAGNTASNAISIKGIKLKGAKYSGTFQAVLTNYNEGTEAKALAWDADNTKWTAAASSADVYSPNVVYDTDADGDTSDDSKSISDVAFAGIGDGLLVIPTHDLATPATSITSFDIEFYLNGNLYTYNYTPATLTFEMGKKYIYDITMTLHEIIVSATVADWEEGSTEYVDIPTYTAGTERTFSIPATAGSYTFRVAGFTGNSTPTVTGTLASVITSATATVTDYTGGVATVKVVVPANGTASAKNGGTIILTDTGTGADPGNNTTVTVNQAAAPAVP